MKSPPRLPTHVQPSFLAGLTLALLVAVVFAGAVQAPFVFDDIEAIVLNPHLTNVWPPNASLWTTEQSPLAGRPLVAFSFAVDHALGGLSPYGYHVVNIALHALTACLLFGLLQQLTGRRRTRLAFAAVLLWAVHPLQTEAVTYVVQRTELLSSAFMVGCLLFAFRGMASARPRWWFLLSALCCLMGVGCKESAAVAPLLVLLFDRTVYSGTFRSAWRRHRALYAGLLSSWVVLAGLMAYSPRSDSVGFDLGVTTWTWLCTQAEVLTHYLRLAFWPSPLALSYGWPLAEGLWSVLPFALLIVGLLAVTVAGLWRRSWWGLAGAWFFVLLAPTSSFVPIVTEVAAERRMYLPLLALSVLLVVALDALLNTVGRNVRRQTAEARPVASDSFWLPIALLAALAGWGTTKHLDTWRSAETLWRATAAARPDNPMAHFMLANSLKRDQRNEEALVSYERALELKPGDFKALLNMGNCQLAALRFEAAEATMRRVVALFPDVVVPRLNLAHALFLLDRAPEAIAELERCIALEPEVVSHRLTLAAMLIDLGTGLDEARAHLEKACALAPQDSRIQKMLDRVQALP